ncbi:MAG: isomerase [Gemmatimonadetes bacterium]|nr:isomerase [Gemmatimonadota bacterium]
MVALPLFTDARASLSFGQVGEHLPFTPQRYFVLFGAGPDSIRGDHAHRSSHQFIVCLSGAFTLTLDDGSARDEIRLTTPAMGVHVRPLTWCVLKSFSPDALVLVLASDLFDDADYIREYDDFTRATLGRRA